MTKRVNNGIDRTKCKACGHTGTVYHTDDNGKRYCGVCRRSGKNAACRVIISTPLRR